MRFGRAIGPGLVALALAGACSAGTEDAQPLPVTTAAPPTSAAGSSTASQLGPVVTSQVTSEGGGQRSEVQVRVEGILTQLEASGSAEGTVITLDERVLFDFNRADLKAEANAALDQIAEVVRFYATAPVSIRGHSDAVGSDAYNDDLSLRRATAVRSHLTDKGRIDAGRLKATGLGKRQPLVPNTRPDGTDDPAGREKNRRVEVVIEGVRR